MKSIMKLGGLAAVCLLLPACATVTRGTKETFHIKTTPNEAQVALSTGQTCVSPCKLKLKRKESFTVTAKKDGYKEAKAEVRSEIHGGGVAGVAGNVLLGGIIGAAVDGSNGAMRDLTPNPLELTLEADTVAAAEVAPAAATVSTEVTDAAPASVPPVTTTVTDQTAADATASAATAPQ